MEPTSLVVAASTMEAGKVALAFHSFLLALGAGAHLEPWEDESFPCQPSLMRSF